MSMKKMNIYKVIEIEHLTESTYRLRTERPNVPIKAGQCFNVGILGAGVNREYSMYSAADAPYVENSRTDLRSGSRLWIRIRQSLHESTKPGGTHRQL